MKKKYNRTRKRKALRRSIIAVLLILTAIFVSPFNFLPSQSLRLQEDDRLTGRTHITRYMLKLPMRPGAIALATLSESENAVVWCMHKYNLVLGWYPSSGTEADCSGDAPAVAADCWISRSKTDENGSVFIGRVMDDRIASVEIVVRVDHPTNPPSQEYICMARQDGFDRTDGPETFCLYAEDSHQYYTNPDGTILGIVPMIRCYDDAGEMIYSAEMNQSWSTSMG